MNDCSPYTLCTPGGGAEKGLFELLFPSCVDVHAPTTRADPAAPLSAVTPAQERALAPPVDVPSPSPSDRIRAWEQALAKSVELSRSTALESSDLIEFQDLLTSRLSHGASFSANDCADGGAVDAVPCALRTRELERRFREQMEVHRELSAASRHIDVVASSVHAFRTERRTRALLQAVTARQEAVWAHVWPEGAPHLTDGSSPDRLASMPGSAIPTTTSATGVPRVSPKGADAPVQPGAAAASGAGSPATASPPPSSPPASPTGLLLKDILDKFSKPREQRDAASPVGSRGGAAVLAASATPPTSEATLSAARKTAFRAECTRPEPPPQPYAVVRYVKARAPSSQALPAEVPTPLSGYGEASRMRHRTTGSLPSAELPRETSSVVEEDEAAYSPELSVTAEDMREGSSVKSLIDDSSGGVHTERSFSEEAYTSDAFDSDIPSKLGSSDRRARTTVSSALTGSVSTTSDVVGAASAGSASRTESVASESSVSDSAAPTRGRRRHRRGHGRHSRSDVSSVLGAADGMQPLADVLHAFYDACRSVTAASTRLLKDPHMRSGNTRATQSPEKPTASGGLTHRLTGSSAQQQPRALSSRPSVTSSTSSPPSAAAVTPSVGVTQPTQDVTVKEWGSALQRQLRRVRRLQRFRDHLLRHLEHLDAQRQAQRKTSQLLQQTRALAQVREEMRAGTVTREGASLADMLKGVKGISAAVTRAAPPRQTAAHRPRAPRFKAASEVSDMEDDVLSEVLSTISSIRSEVDSGMEVENSAITEDIASFGAGASSIVSDSVITGEPQGWDGSTAPVSEVASASTAMLGTPAEMSYVDDSFEGSSEEVRSSVAVTSNGLDEIEDELATRLAELSSGALSVNTSVPSDVAELVDLLPPSLIPSEVEESGVASDVATVITAAVSDTSSVADLRTRQRRLYVSAKGAALERGGDGVLGGASYLRDSPGASVYSVPEDADVDASTGPSSADTVTDISAHSASAGPARADADSAEGAASSAPTTADVTTALQEAGARDSETSTYASSSSDDALTVLEADMARTKRRRQHALSTATAIPTFAQLYDPTVRPAPDASPSDRESTTTDSAGSVHMGRDGDSHKSSVGQSSARSDQAPAVAADDDAYDEGQPSGAQQSADVRGVAATPTTTPAASRRVEAATQAGPPTAASAVGTSTEGATRSAGRAYQPEDFVAQRAWKARQLHVLRQLRQPAAGASDRASALRLDDDGNESESVGRPAAQNSVDLALTAAEAAAREEWAQHWGVVESLLHTRFESASSMQPSRRPLARRTAHRLDLQESLRSTSSPSYSRDASSSTVATTASSASAGSAR